MQQLSTDEIRCAVRTALAEDVGGGDVTSLAVVPSGLTARAMMIARVPLVVAGLALAEETFHQVSLHVHVERTTNDSSSLIKGEVMLKVSGPAQSILTAERVALNFVQRLSGIATLTARFVDAIRDTQAVILDTRKTTPGLRRLEKYAVACGGGRNHRFGLFDMVLIKDNHLAALRGSAPNPIAAAVSAARQRHPELKVEVEVDSLEQLKLALIAQPDILLLDNMTTDQLRAAVKLIAGQAKTEASGGVNLSTIRAIAETGVDFISVGALTHSAPAVDIALDFET